MSWWWKKETQVGHEQVQRQLAETRMALGQAQGLVDALNLVVERLHDYQLAMDDRGLDDRATIP